MTSERSKRRDFLSLIFIPKTGRIKKKHRKTRENRDNHGKTGGIRGKHRKTWETTGKRRKRRKNMENQEKHGKTRENRGKT